MIQGFSVEFFNYNLSIFLTLSDQSLYRLTRKLWWLWVASSCAVVCSMYVCGHSMNYRSKESYGKQPVRKKDHGKAIVHKVCRCDEIMDRRHENKGLATSFPVIGTKATFQTCSHARTCQCMNTATHTQTRVCDGVQWVVPTNTVLPTSGKLLLAFLTCVRS
ncbi:uncharacterized protein CYBJADRAFT_29385 [Cyberlindnera jadinii NRRL Y-1542]|uniref:Uncharacterized protein n=1 Tax=Cyberlindnera jadinii (strain ATCC 18201 / CBS 1600 / BCRC 20928 / JCM 3617 / NBRC 0987 / NRRL Y-1542) TaxID=983966 RepID=A0A1E4RWH4_CYBJN|nr:hypothetical protein CYBJADRAFT_29385 [Cyberlindnera jadinii NRRL Y-1542]ODV71596.1 hypothetical protein CYBJADRAFT_29385 [Cyberlindnera jadinii NRRL Y-1542]